MTSVAIAHAAPVPNMDRKAEEATKQRTVDLLAQWKQLSPAKWEAPAPHKPIPQTSGSDTRPAPANEGPTQADPASAQAAAQRCKELMNSWRALRAQQRRSTSLDDQELLQHQMSQMRDNIDKMRMTSFEYGR